MTDKQLAILLTQYHNQLIDIAHGLLNSLKGNPALEYHIHLKKGKWIGNGQEPSFGLNYNEHDWEWIEEKGDPVCLDELGIFTKRLLNDINSLENEEYEDD